MRSDPALLQWPQCMRRTQRATPTPSIVIFKKRSQRYTRLTHTESSWLPARVNSLLGLPSHSYGDYQNAALASGRAVVSFEARVTTGATLRWYGDPTSPLGQSCDPPQTETAWPTGVGVLDMVYTPLRLDGSTA